jgi:hypothetical protein
VFDASFQRRRDVKKAAKRDETSSPPLGSDGRGSASPRLFALAAAASDLKVLPAVVAPIAADNKSSPSLAAAAAAAQQAPAAAGKPHYAGQSLFAAIQSQKRKLEMLEELQALEAEQEKLKADVLHLRRRLQGGDIDTDEEDDAAPVSERPLKRRRVTEGSNGAGSGSGLGFA